MGCVGGITAMGDIYFWAQITDVVGLSVTGANAVGLSAMCAFAVGSFVVVGD